MDHLFEMNGTGGSDLIARNIQRGRDHGLPAYIEFRKLWEKKSVSDFEDLDNISDEVNCKISKNVYAFKHIFF